MRNSAFDSDETQTAVSAFLPLDANQKASVRILVVDDELTLRESCGSVLKQEGYNVLLCGRGTEALNLLQRRQFDIVLLDLYMSQVSGMDLLRAGMEANPETIVIIMTGNPSVETSVEALRAGAWDYLPKPFSASHLQILIGRAVHTVMVSRESGTAPAAESPEPLPEGGATLLGNSPEFRKVIELAEKVARTDASVFITGESGTGKELIAQFIHQHSRRRSRPLVAVNCAALPEPLLESEMFGHVKGAFTGAVRDKTGILETANGGTLFLDELTEMPLSIQAKLLRVIQDGVLRRVGSNTTDAVVNVRFIAATNRDPQEAVQDGLLREDLYYRLRVVPIRIPPLRSRPEDIALLAQHFLNTYWTRHRQGEALPNLSAAAIRALRSHPWKGNVRELQNIIEHAVVLLDPEEEILPDNIPFLEEAAPTGNYVTLPPGLDEDKYHVARERVLAEFEREYLTALVNRARGNMSEAARIAGVDRTTLYRLMAKHGLERDTTITAKSG